MQAIVTDIEGTITSIAFVHDVLFPYARARMHAFVAAHPQAVSADVLVQWLDDDRKEPLLKLVQGMIWADGYASGELVGELYPDVAGMLRRWRDAGIRLYIYSSGSEQAQRLLVKHSCAGDLSALFDGYFDTRVGAKREASSYAAIARAIDTPVSEIAFLSDTGAELDAARSVGMVTVQLVRDDAAMTDHARARDFVEATAILETR